VSLRAGCDAADHPAPCRISGPHLRAALGALLAALALAGAPAAAHASTYVDGASTGGACSDARIVARAASPATPWCSLVTAALKAPSGWTIENNVFARSSGTPLQLDNQMDDLVVANNTFTAGGVGVRPSVRFSLDRAATVTVSVATDPPARASSAVRRSPPAAARTPPRSPRA